MRNREDKVRVYDKNDKPLAPCSRRVAWVLLKRKRAIEIDEDTIKIILDKKDIKAMRKRVIKRDNRVCQYCGIQIPEDEQATVDHVNPKNIRGDECGYDSEDNLVCSCVTCNGEKDNMPLEEYIKLKYVALLSYMLFVSNR